MFRTTGVNRIESDDGKVIQETYHGITGTLEYYDGQATYSVGIEMLGNGYTFGFAESNIVKNNRDGSTEIISNQQQQEIVHVIRHAFADVGQKVSVIWKGLAADRLYPDENLTAL